MKNLPNWKRIEKELWKNKTASEKLDYLAFLNETITGPLMQERDNIKAKTWKGKKLTKQEEKRLTKLEDFFWSHEKGVTSDFHVPVYFIEKIADKHGKEPEYSLWFITYRAKQVFKIKCEMSDFKEELNSPLAKSFIRARLDKLRSFEEKALQLLESGQINIFQSNLSFPHNGTVEFLRLSAGYYQNHFCNYTYFGQNTPVEIYCDHWLMKPYLESELEKWQESTNTSKAVLGPVIKDSASDLQDILKKENQFIIGMPISEVYEHFKVFTTVLSKNKKPFLTEKQLLQLLDVGFCKNLYPSRITFNCCEGESGFIIKRFYDFYLKAQRDYNHFRNKEPFIKQVVELADNWTIDQVTSSFRSGRVRRSW